MRVIFFIVMLATPCFPSTSPQRDFKQISYGDYLFNEYQRTGNPELAKMYQDWKKSNGECDAMRLIKETNQDIKRIERKSK